MHEDPRKTGLKNGLRQLTVEQLQCVIDYPGERWFWILIIIAMVISALWL